MNENEKVSIGIVHDGKIDAQLSIDLMNLTRLRGDRLNGFIHVPNIGLLTRSRNMVVKAFLDNTLDDWLLIVDADQSLTVSTFDKLIEAADRVLFPVLSGLVFGALFNEFHQLIAVPTIYREGERGLEPIDEYPLDSVISIDSCGTGLMIIHRSILEYIRDQADEERGRDWAWFTDGAFQSTWFGEDIMFCKLLKHLDIPLHCHTGALAPHRKEFWLTQDHYLAMREEDTQEQE